MKAQISLETIVVIGIMITILAIIISINTDITSTFSIVENEKNIDQALQTITSSAQFVFSQGLGAKEEVWIQLPGNIHNSSINNQTIEFYLYSARTGTRRMGTTLPFPINGTLPENRGRHRITIESFGGFVNVS
ncbi:MAG: hypothetical protein ACMXYK_05070 [Candidatus Woesearchaeota archaeon]